MQCRHGLSLLELLAVLGVIAALVAVILPRVADRCTDTDREACYLHQGEIEMQCQLWRRANGSFPAGNLSDIKANSSYFPEGLPSCPVDGTAYTIDTTTGHVSGHTH